MLVPAGSPIFFLREHRFAVRCRVVTLMQLLWTLCMLLFMLSTCLLHIFLYIFFINIGCASSKCNSISPFYDVCNCFIICHLIITRILAAELNYRFTNSKSSLAIVIQYSLQEEESRNVSSRVVELVESHVFSWSRSRFFETAGVGVGFSKLLESESEHLLQLPTPMFIK